MNTETMVGYNYHLSKSSLAYSNLPDGKTLSFTHNFVRIRPEAV